jgi:hypothetical protein
MKNFMIKHRTPQGNEDFEFKQDQIYDLFAVV